MDTIRALGVAATAALLLLFGSAPASVPPVDSSLVAQGTLPVAPAVDSAAHSSRQWINLFSSLGVVAVLIWYIKHNVAVVEPRHERVVATMAAEHTAAMKELADKNTKVLRELAEAFNQTTLETVRNCGARRDKDSGP